MRLDAYLRAHGFLRLERPPLLWEADSDEEPFVRLLGEMIVIGLLRGNALAELTLNVANVVVEENASGRRLDAGDYVAVTIRGRGRWGPEAVWWPNAAAVDGLIARLADCLRDARGRLAYSRDLGQEGCVTVFLRRLGSEPPGIPR